MSYDEGLGMSYFAERQVDRLVESITKLSESKTPEQIREQRRYEIARDCMAGLAAKFSHTNDKEVAQISVRWADALLAAMEEKR
jgi:hypothetical protein